MTTFNRRMVLRAGGALALAGAGFPRTSRTWAQANPLPEVQALLFDVFGTLVDWRNGVAREAERVLKPLGYSLDWLAFADAWRAEHQPGMDEIRTGRQAFVKLDVIHRRMLDKIKRRFGLEKVDGRRRRSLISRGIGSTPGRMSGRAWRGCEPGCSCAPAPTATSPSWQTSAAATICAGTQSWARKLPETLNPNRASILLPPKRLISSPANA